MTQQPEPARVFTELDYIKSSDGLLTKIEEHLRSIRSIMKFFLFLVILAIVLQGCALIFR